MILPKRHWQVEVLTPSEFDTENLHYIIYKFTIPYSFLNSTDIIRTQLVLFSIYFTCHRWNYQRVVLIIIPQNLYTTEFTGPGLNIFWQSKYALRSAGHAVSLHGFCSAHQIIFNLYITTVRIYIYC